MSPSLILYKKDRAWGYYFIDKYFIRKRAIGEKIGSEAPIGYPPPCRCRPGMAFPKKSRGVCNNGVIALDPFLL